MKIFEKNKKHLAIFLAAAAMGLGPNASAWPNYSRSTTAYFAPQTLVSSVGGDGRYRVYAGAGVDFGFEHDFNDSGILLNGFYRYGQRRLDSPYYQEQQQITGGGLGLGARIGRAKMIAGYYGQKHERLMIGSESEDSELAWASEEGLLTRFGYELYRRGGFGLQLELGAEFGRTYYPDVGEGQADHQVRNVTAGVSAHFGKFCGGQVLAVSAVVLALVAACRYGCGDIFYFRGSGSSSSSCS